jgi:iron complex transport system substrate-binding protein
MGNQYCSFSVKKNRILIFFIFLSCAFTVQGFAGHSQRIVSLSPYLTEEVYLLGAGDRLVGVTIYCNRPSQAEKKEKIGTMIEPNIEKIVGLKPDMVLAAKEGNKPGTVNRLRNFGIKVEVFDEKNDFEGIKKDFLALGKLLDCYPKAKEVIEGLNLRIDSVKEKVKSLSKPRVFCQLGSKPLITAARGTFINQIIEISGGINIAGGVESRYPQYSLEEVVRRDPEVILIVTMGDVTMSEVKKWERFRDVSAVKNNRIYVIDADLICRPTPFSFVESVEQTARYIHNPK